MSASRATVIEYSESIENKVPPELRLQFTLPVQYISHSPRETADEIKIQVRFLQTVESDITDKQRLAGNYSKAVPILDICKRPGNCRIDPTFPSLPFLNSVAVVPTEPAPI